MTRIFSDPLWDAVAKQHQELNGDNTETVLEVRYSTIINSYCYRTDKNSGFDSESAIKNELDGTFRNIVSIKSKP